MKGRSKRRSTFGELVTTVSLVSRSSQEAALTVAGLLNRRRVKFADGKKVRVVAH